MRISDWSSDVCSSDLGTIQIAAGIERVFGIPAGRTLQLAVIAVAFVLYMASTATGVERGIKWLSSFNLALAAVLLALVLVLGPTGFTHDPFTTTLGPDHNTLLTMTLHMAPFPRHPWV